MTDEKKPGVTLVMPSNRSTIDMLAPGMPPTEIKDPIGDVPVVQGAHGRAWLCNLDEGHRKLKVPPEKITTLDHWIIEAPWAHPAWHSYSLILMHLRDIGIPTKYYIPEATHELWLYVINPDIDRRPVLLDGIPQSMWLTPMNFGAQFIEITDDLARQRVRNSVQMICDGKLSPDSDFTQQWIALYNNSMIKKEFRR